MCTRYYFEQSLDQLSRISEIALLSPLAERFRQAGSDVRLEGEIRPTDVAPVIALNRGGKQTVFPMRWGFRVPGGPLLVNARSETAGQKPSFRESWAARRCVIPAAWYFEWEHIPDGNGRRKPGRRYGIRPRDGAPVWLCGLYRMEDGLPAFTVLTREPSQAVAGLHDRMPLLLPEALIQDWITPQNDPRLFLNEAVTDVFLFLN